MRRFLGLMALGILLSTLPASAAVQASSITLDPHAETLAPSVRILDADRADVMRIELRLPALEMQSVPLDGETFDALSIAGGGLIGDEGRAALPTFSRLVAVPAGMAVSARVLDRDEQVLTGYRPLPLQPADARELVMDRDWYAAGRAAERAAVAVGEPATLRDLRVVPVTFQPVSYDPASGELRVASRVEVELDFTESGNAAPRSPRRRDLIPESFDRLYGDAVLGYRSGEAQVGPGTIMYVSRGTVNAQLEPLLEWRREQGYNVVHYTGGGSGSSTIKNAIQSQYDSATDPPLEFVCLVGDATGSYGVACWFESYSGYGGEGDHEYALLEGGDWLADVHIGRLSFDSTSQLTNIVNKILDYEQSPPTGDDGWFTRGRLFGDPSHSGITTVWVNDWVQDQLEAIGFDDVTVSSGGNFVTNMTLAVNNGCSVFGYRGYYNMSGWTASGISNTSNSRRSCFAVIPTCDTGSFSDDGMCRSEAFLRSTNGGGIGGIGTATIGTHTRYNNCYFMGTWEGVLNGSDHRTGVAHSRGKLDLFSNYTNYEDSKVYIWSMWNNLMGDPATDVYLAAPGSFDVSYPGNIDTQMASVAVDVSEGASPVEDALVCLYKDGQLSVTAYTDYAGRALLPVSGLSGGTVNVTVTKHNYIPHRGTMTAGSTANVVAASDRTVDDDTSGGSNGNGDGRVNPGEAIELPVALTNYHSSGYSSVSATIASIDPAVSIVDGSETFGTINAGATVWSAEDFDVTIAANAQDGHDIDLDLTATSGLDSWHSLVRLTVASADFAYTGFSWGGGGGTLDPGEGGSFSISLSNDGSVDAGGISAVLSTQDNWVEVSDANGSYADMGVGGSGSSSNSFSLNISPDCFEGHLATFTLTLSFNGGAMDVVEFSLPVGTASSNDPLGPDSYGYYAFDNTDTGYPWAPGYEWVEINPNLGGQGTDLGLTDFGWEQDDTQVVTLPFTFQYYGEPFTQASICSNGWVAMGQTDLTFYRNWTIPSAGNPDAMIAGCFDNLIQSGSSKVYTWYDSENGRYIIEYSQLRNDYSNAVEEFQIILMDPSVHVTTTGDGPILVQYKTVNNTDARDGYLTVGITNLDGTDGLLYTYAADYAPAAATLQSGRAILFQPIGQLALGTLEGDLTNTSDGNAPVADVGVKIVENNQTLVSAENGHYSGSVQEGTYTVQVLHESFETVTVTGVDIVEDQVTVQDFALVDILGPYLLNVTGHPHTDDTVGPYAINANITDFSTITEMHCYYKINGGGQFEAPLTLLDAAAGLYRADIPGYPLSTGISYWFEATDIAGNSSREPTNAGEYYEFYVVPMIEVLADDLESDQGWTVGAAGDDANTGIWTRVDPIGVYSGSTPVQPEDDVTAAGTLCYITGNAETGSQGADDVDGGQTTLLSPVFDLSDMLSATVSYYRWYTNDTGDSPDSDYWVVQISDDGSSWVNLENTNVSTHAWTHHSFEVTDYVGLTNNVQLRFIASDEGSGSVVEAGVDEFMLIGFGQPDATGAGDGAAPASLTVLQNMPNPFNPKTSIRFGLPAAGEVSVKVFDAGGRLVRTLLDGERQTAGFHGVEWNGRDDASRQASSGIYFYVVEAAGERMSGKMTLLK